MGRTHDRDPQVSGCNCWHFPFSCSAWVWDHPIILPHGVICCFRKKCSLLINISQHINVMLKRFLFLEKWPTAHNFNNLLHYGRGTNDQTCQSSGRNGLPSVSPEEECGGMLEGGLYYLGRGLFLRTFGSESEMPCVDGRCGRWSVVAGTNSGCVVTNYSRVNLVFRFQSHCGLFSLSPGWLLNLRMEGNKMKLRIYWLRLYEVYWLCYLFFC